jgi:hypothetical protein
MYSPFKSHLGQSWLGSVVLWGKPMGTHFVVGGIYHDLNGNETFSLVCPSSGELPYVMDEGVKHYFKLIWQNAHLYRVEADYTLSLVALSPEAVQCGIAAPESVTPNLDLMERLRSVIKLA